MKSYHGALWILLAMLITPMVGCEGGQTRPIMDYSPENVEDIRKAQGLEPDEAAAEDADQSAEQEPEDGSEEE